MNDHVGISPPNSLLLIMDQSIGQVPEAMRGQLVSTSWSCVAVGTVADADGEVVVVLSDREPLHEQGMRRVFQGNLPTPSGQLAVCSVLDEPYLTLEVPGETAQIDIWANHEKEPDHLYVVAKAIGVDG